MFSSIDPLYIGSLGAALILFAFVLGQLHIWKDTYFVYDFLNLLGGALLVWYAYSGNSWPFLVLNAVWVLVSLRDVVMDYGRNTRKGKALGPWDKWMH